MQPNSSKIWELNFKIIGKGKGVTPSRTKHRNLNIEQIVKFSFIVMHGKRKLCDCHERFNEKDCC